MARFPSLSWSALAIRESIFSRLARRLAECDGEVYPFYLGDTWLAPPRVAQLPAMAELEGDFYRYGAPPGEPELLEALVDKCRQKNGLHWVDRSCLQVTAGATLALHAAVRALLDPGDELAICAPYWPLIRGIATDAGALPIEIELSQRLYSDPGLDVYELLAEGLTERTRAIFFATPNNPDGKVLPRSALEAIARFARDHNLWVLVDEVYEDFTYGEPHCSLASLEGMASRTITVYSLSKSLALAGYRLGYAVAEPRVMHCLRKVVNHSIYNVPAVLQHLALRALREGDTWMAQARDVFRAAREIATREVGLPHFAPDGGAYLFLNLREYLGNDDEAVVMAFHDRLLSGGVALSPGAPFGSGYRGYARLCFGALPPDRLTAGLAQLRRLL